MKKTNTQPTSEETTAAGLMEAITTGEISATELIDTLIEKPDLMEADAADKAMSNFKKMAQKGDLPGASDDEDCDCECGKCPACKKKKKDESEDAPIVVPDQGLVLQTFEAMVDEGCGLKDKKKKKGSKIPPQFRSKLDTKKGKKKESISGKKPILEFAAPERQDVIRWARGDEPKRQENKTPFWFKDDEMISQNVVVARRNVEEKQAQVVHPQNLSAYVGRHAVLANHGLRFAGYDVEVVDTL